MATDHLLIDRLKGLTHEIWRGNLPVEMLLTLKDRQPSRKLSQEEWEWLRRVMLEGRVVVKPLGCPRAWDFELHLYSVPPDSIYPGENRPKPVILLGIRGWHLPDGAGGDFDRAWEVMSPFSHNEANGRLLKEYLGLDLRERAHFEY